MATVIHNKVPNPFIELWTSTLVFGETPDFLPWEFILVSHTRISYCHLFGLFHGANVQIICMALVRGHLRRCEAICWSFGCSCKIFNQFITVLCIVVLCLKTKWTPGSLQVIRKNGSTGFALLSHWGQAQKIFCTWHNDGHVSSFEWQGWLKVLFWYCCTF